jgi:hypothetical protein
MLTKRQNMVETMKGGNPDRFVKGYEALSLVITPYSRMNARRSRAAPIVNSWGVTISYPDNAPAVPVPMRSISLSRTSAWRILLHHRPRPAEAAWADVIAEVEGSTGTNTSSRRSSRARRCLSRAITAGDHQLPDSFYTNTDKCTRSSI